MPFTCARIHGSSNLRAGCVRGLSSRACATEALQPCACRLAAAPGNVRALAPCTCTRIHGSSDVCAGC
eukprot:7397065-Lingulodinium_polyedra.AAC.1